MFEASELIYSILNGAAPLTNLGVQINPVIADQKERLPLLNYFIAEAGKVSKDNMYAFTLSFRIYSKEYDEALKIVDAVKEVLGAAQTKFQYRGTAAPQADEEGEIFIGSNYQFNK